MRREELDLILQIVDNLVCLQYVDNSPEACHTRKSALDRLHKIVDGIPGTGACICQHGPENFYRMWGHAKIEPREGNMIFDHRCAKHGEKAQPALWGRHREKELSVSREQWESLGVEYPS